jgi:hypothetical protein
MRVIRLNTAGVQITVSKVWHLEHYARDVAQLHNDLGNSHQRLLLALIDPLSNR